ncbi:MAG: acyltransferase, partial [Verrucomicrobiota bacterium]|nr:acyltransferase [Verrucomicrobiota bacterium]
VIGLVVQPDLPLLRGRGLVHIGKISYGIYLLHMFILSSVKKIPGGDQPGLCFLLTTALVVMLASVVYRYFEQPIIRFYKNRLSPLASAPTVPRQATDPALPASQPAVEN